MRVLLLLVAGSLCLAACNSAPPPGYTWVVQDFDYESEFYELVPIDEPCAPKPCAPAPCAPAPRAPTPTYRAPSPPPAAAPLSPWTTPPIPPPPALPPGS